MRPGTEPVGLVVAMTEALEDASNPRRLAPRRAQYDAMARLVWDALLPYIVAGVVLPTGPAWRDGAERPHRRIHATGDDLAGPFKQDLVEIDHGLSQCFVSCFGNEKSSAVAGVAGSVSASPGEPSSSAGAQNKRSGMACPMPGRKPLSRL